MEKKKKKKKGNSNFPMEISEFEERVDARFVYVIILPERNGNSRGIAI